MDYTLQGEFRTSVLGFRRLMSFYHAMCSQRGKSVNLHFGRISFFDANMSAVLLAIIEELKINNKVRFNVDYEQIKSSCEILVRNGFAAALLSETKVNDERQSTVPIKLFGPTDADQFASYIENDFLAHRGLIGKLSAQVVDDIKGNYYEIFGNVECHAQTRRPVYTCGQYYPKKNEFKFTLVDVGIGFLKNISATHPKIRTSSEAVGWALSGNNSNKKGKTKGGTGLKSISKYCEVERGEFHIVSGDCYWVRNGTKIVESTLDEYFCGTTIHLIFRY